MKSQRGMRGIVLTVSVALAVTSCGTPATPRTQSWTGTTTYGAVVYPLQLAVTVRGSEWSGTYTVGSTPPFTGDVDAEVVDGVVTGRLIATTSCSYDLEGAVTAEALEAAFTPTQCPGGEAGTWLATPTEARP